VQGVAHRYGNASGRAAAHGRRRLRRHRRQEALGIVGVNLADAAFYHHSEPATLIESLIDAVDRDGEAHRFASTALACSTRVSSSFPLGDEGVRYLAQGGEHGLLVLNCYPIEVGEIPSSLGWMTL
jgi:hypothetical protein